MERRIQYRAGRRNGLTAVQRENDLKAQTFLFLGTVIGFRLACGTPQPGTLCYDLEQKIVGDQAKDFSWALAKAFAA